MNQRRHNPDPDYTQEANEVFDLLVAQLRTMTTASFYPNLDRIVPQIKAPIVARIATLLAELDAEDAAYEAEMKAKREKKEKVDLLISQLDEILEWTKQGGLGFTQGKAIEAKEKLIQDSDPNENLIKTTENLIRDTQKNRANVEDVQQRQQRIREEEKRKEQEAEEKKARAKEQTNRAIQDHLAALPYPLPPHPIVDLWEEEIIPSKRGAKETIHQAPIWTGNKDFMAIIKKDMTAPGGLSRDFFAKSDSDKELYEIPVRFVPGDPVELGGTGGSRKNPTKERWYGVLALRTPNKIIVEGYNNAAEAFARSIQIREFLRTQKETESQKQAKVQQALEARTEATIMQAIAAAEAKREMRTVDPMQEEEEGEPREKHKGPSIQELSKTIHKPTTPELSEEEKRKEKWRRGQELLKSYKIDINLLEEGLMKIYNSLPSYKKQSESGQQLVFLKGEIHAREATPHMIETAIKIVERSHPSYIKREEIESTLIKPGLSEAEKEAKLTSGIDASLEKIMGKLLG